MPVSQPRHWICGSVSNLTATYYNGRSFVIGSGISGNIFLCYDTFALSLDSCAQHYASNIRVGKKLHPFRWWRKKYLSIEQKLKKNRPGGGDHAAPRQVKKKTKTLFIDWVQLRQLQRDVVIFWDWLIMIVSFLIRHCWKFHVGSFI